MSYNEDHLGQAQRFDTEGTIVKFQKEMASELQRGVSEMNISTKEYQFARNLENSWGTLEDECDAHNVTEAFRLMQEAETEKEKKAYIKFYKTVLKGITSPNGNRPIKWEKQWDA